MARGRRTSNRQRLKNLLPQAGFTYPPKLFVSENRREDLFVLDAMAASVEHTGLVYPAMVDTMLEKLFVQLGRVEMISKLRRSSSFGLWSNTRCHGRVVTHGSRLT